MLIESAKCTNCGANLSIDATKDIVKCEFCGTIFIPKNNSCEDLDDEEMNDFHIIAGRLEWYCGDFKKAIVPNGVKCIGEHAFDYRMKEVVLPDSVVRIEGNAFKNHDYLTKVNIPAGVTTIEPDTFCGCSSLTEIVIPDGVIVIGYHAFQGCLSLQKVYIPNSVVEIQDGAFGACSSLEEIVISNSSVKLGNKLFEGCTSLKKINSIPYSTWNQQREESADRKEMMKRRSDGLCQYCGHPFKGVFIKRCTHCNRKKDYD